MPRSFARLLCVVRVVSTHLAPRPRRHAARGTPSFRRSRSSQSRSRSDITISLLISVVFVLVSNESKFGTLSAYGRATLILTYPLFHLLIASWYTEPDTA